MYLTSQQSGHVVVRAKARAKPSIHWCIPHRGAAAEVHKGRRQVVVVLVLLPLGVIIIII